MDRRAFISRAAVSASATALAASSAAAMGSCTDDTAVMAVQEWLAAMEAARHYRPPSDMDWEDDPKAVALDRAKEAAYRQMARTQPTTMAGMAALVRAHFFCEATYCAGGTHVEFDHADTWNWKSLSVWEDNRDRLLVETMLGATS